VPVVDKLQISVKNLHSHLDTISWQILHYAVKHKDRGLVQLHQLVEATIDRAILGEIKGE